MIKRYKKIVFTLTVVCSIFFAAAGCAQKNEKKYPMAKAFILPRPGAVLIPRKTPPRVILTLSDQAMRSLRRKRNAALIQGQLLKVNKTYYPASMASIEKKVQVRLKGDLPDHWKRDDHWSFRVKLPKGSAFMGTSTFSLHHPDTRKGVWEMLANRLFAQEGFLVPQYQWVFLTLNGKDLGLYALEEAFSSKYISKRQKRGDGIVLRLDTEGVGKQGRGIVFSTRKLQPFRKGSVKKKPRKQKALETIRLRYRAALKNASKVNKVFDLARYARFVALSDFLYAFHPHYTGNIRLYLDPKTHLLEPFGSDFWAGNTLTQPFGLAEARLHNPDKSLLPLVSLMARHKDFRAAYLPALRHYSSDDFFESFARENIDWLEQEILFLRKYLPKPIPDPARPGVWNNASMAVYHDMDLTLLLHNQVFMSRSIPKYMELNALLDAGKALPKVILK